MEKSNSLLTQTNFVSLDQKITSVTQILVLATDRECHPLSSSSRAIGKTLKTITTAICFNKCYEQIMYLTAILYYNKNA